MVFQNKVISMHNKHHILIQCYYHYVIKSVLTDLFKLREQSLKMFGSGTASSSESISESSESV